MVLADVTELFNLWSMIGCFISKHVSSLRVSVTAKKKSKHPGGTARVWQQTGADVCFPDVVFGRRTCFVGTGGTGAIFSLRSEECSVKVTTF